MSNNNKIGKFAAKINAIAKKRKKVILVFSKNYIIIKWSDNNNYTIKKKYLDNIYGDVRKNKMLVYATEATVTAKKRPKNFYADCINRKNYIIKY